MPTLLELQSDAILRAAAQAEYGIIVRIIMTATIVAPTLRAKQVLYAYRRNLGPDFKAIQIRLSPRDPDHELWLINGNNIIEPEAQAQVDGEDATLVDVDEL